MRKSPIRPGFLGQVFTPQERLALAFVLGILLLGIGLRWLHAAGASGGASAGASHAAQEPRSRWVSASPEVRVNRAGAAELAALPGIGPMLARRIAEERRQRGSFLTLSDLKRVKGVTPKTLQKLEGLVRFD